MEEKYSFRERLGQVHIPVRDLGIKPRKNEIIIDGSWEIIISENAGKVITAVAGDLKEYFQVAMGMVIGVKAMNLGPAGSNKFEKKIIIDTFNKHSSYGMKSLTPAQGCRILCDRQNIYIIGGNEKNAARGCYALENVFNLKKGPCLKAVDLVLENRFSPRMVHSGWGLDIFPDNYLKKIAHAGFDSILIYYRRSDAAAERVIEINNLIERASTYGIGVYLYFNTYRYPKPEYDTMHPGEEGAEEYYESFYGKAFKNHPDAVGCILVGESCAFPSHDPESRSDVLNKTGTKPHPGWWPCHDYPQYLALVKKVITKYKPDADIVFWTYNWGRAPENKRIELIKNLPPGISLLVTFEMFETLNGIEHCADYTIKFEGPGKCFISEAKAAKAKKIRLYAMSNTGGRTWDFGVVPYIPVPFQWARRWKKLLEANRQWGLSGLMESHHYGWHPSHISRLGEYFATSPETNNPDKFLFELVKSDFGDSSAKRLMKAWKFWSNSINLLPASSYDQYGPLRVGPSYPFHFTETDAPNIPPDPDVLCQRSIVVPLYSPGSNDLLNHEIRSVKKLTKIWRQGMEELKSGLPDVLENGRSKYGRIITLGNFINHTLITLLNIKLWWQLRMKLKGASSSKNISDLLGKMTVVAEDEINNTEETIKIVEEDSRLGWEPRMGYLTDKSRLFWKIRQLERVLKEKMPEYRQSPERQISGKHTCPELFRSKF